MIHTSMILYVLHELSYQFRTLNIDKYSLFRQNDHFIENFEEFFYEIMLTFFFSVLIQILTTL